MNIGALLLSVLLLLTNGFFVAVEFANVAARRSKLEALASDGDRRARLALDASRQLSLQLAGAQLGITLASLLLGFVAEPAIAHVIEPALHSFGAGRQASEVIGVGIALVIVVFLHMVLGEMVPKNMAMTNPEATARLLAGPMRSFLTAAKPVVWFLNHLAALLTRLLGVVPRDEVAGPESAQEISQMVDESHDEGTIEDAEHRLISGVLELPTRAVGTAMTPRERIAGLPATSSVADAQALAATSRFSRLVVYETDIDHVVGLVHAKDMLFIDAASSNQPLPGSLIRPVLSVPPSQPIDDVLERMLSSRLQFAVVHDDTHRVVGVTTLEDLLETVVGEILDEYGH